MQSPPSKSKFFYRINPHRLSEYENKSLFFSKPCLVAFYEYNHGRITSAKRIKYFKEPKSDQYPIDLNAEQETFVQRDRTMNAQNIELSLKYDMSPDAERDSAENVEKTKVLTRRGTLVHLMELYYNKHSKDSIKIRVSRYNHNLYMVMEEFDDSFSELKSVHTHHSRLEQLLFADSPDGTPNIDEACDQNVVLVGVHRSNFGKYDIIYSGEIQGILDNEKITNFDDLDELTDRRFVMTKQMWKTLKDRDTKYLKIWLQAYLANVRDLYIGYKIETGIIYEPIEHQLAKDLHKNRFWKPSICTGILYEFLQNVEKRMSSVNCLNTVYVFEYNRKANNFTYEVFKGKNEKSFITEEYIKYCKEKLNT